MQSLGEEGATTYESQAPEIFAEQVSKIVNDKQILTTRTELLAQLQSAREIAYPCTFTIQKIFCDVAKKPALSISLGILKNWDYTKQLFP